LAGAAKWNTGNDNVNGNFTIYDAIAALDRMVVTNTGNVGIGTTAPAFKLDVQSSTTNPTIRAASTGGAIGNYGELILQSWNTLSGVGQSYIRGISTATGNSNTDLTFGVNASGFGSPFEAMRITNAGNVGIGTSTPAYPLSFGKSVYADPSSVDFYRICFQDNGGIANDVGIGQPSNFDMGLNVAGGGFIGFYNGTNGIKARIDNDGLKFGTDTAAANALDDYEEGTWTMGISFGGGSTGVTYSTTTGTYTKIGRQVTVNGILSLTSKGSSTGDAIISGLPFTIASGASNYPVVNFRFNAVTFLNQFQGYGAVNNTIIILEEITSLGVTSALTNADFANNSDIIVSFTYFV